MAIFLSFPLGWFEKIVRDAVRRRVEELLPLPDRTIVSDLTGAILTELTQQPELPHMAIQDFPVTLSGDAPHGYQITFPVPTDKTGVAYEGPATMATDNEAVCSAVWLSPGNVWLRPVAASNPGDACLVSGSYVDGDMDDIRFPVTIGSDRIVSNLEGATVVELDADPVLPA